MPPFPAQYRGAALVALAAMLAACGSGTTTQPADGAAPASSGSGGKTIVFSPLSLKIPAMNSLVEGIKTYGTGHGYEIVVQDPDFDPQKQVTDLQKAIESGRATGAWAITVQPASMRALVKVAQDHKVPLILNGSPSDYGLPGPVPGVAFSVVDYTSQGSALGEELGNCINERLDGAAKVLFEENSPGTAGKDQLENTAKQALAAAAPNAKIVASVVVSDRAKVKADVAKALQSHPDVTAVLGNNDEGSLGAIDAFAAAGRKLPCLTAAGGNDEALQAVKDGKIYASVAQQFQADMAQSFDALVSMIYDPTATGLLLTVPQKVVKGTSS